MINDILDFSKIEAGKIEMEESGLRPARLHRRHTKTLPLQAHEKGLELLCEVAAGSAADGGGRSRPPCDRCCSIFWWETPSSLRTEGEVGLRVQADVIEGSDLQRYTLSSPIRELASLLRSWT